MSNPRGNSKPPALLTFLLSLLPLTTYAATPAPAPISSHPTGTQSVIYNDPITRVYYPRIMEFRYSPKDNSSLLATCEEYKRPMPVYPIYKSADKGKSWLKIGEVKDTQHEWGMRYQPFLFELPQPVARLQKGTLLCAGNSIPNDLSKTSIDLYRSDDGGITWSFMSTVCQGGRATPNGQEDPVWEPFLILDKQGRLVCYESDERDPAHNQLLCHFISEDGGLTWGKQVNDVTLGRLRPGMPVIAPLPNGKYIMTYEMVGTPGNAITFKLSDDAINWGDPSLRGTAIITADGYHPGSTPYCVWTPSGGKNGTIIASGRIPLDPTGGDFVVNYNNAEGPWYRMHTPIKYDNANPAATNIATQTAPAPPATTTAPGRGRGGGGGNAGYSRAMTVSSDGRELYSVVELNNGQRSRLNMTFYRFPLEPVFDWSYELTAACSYQSLAADAATVAQHPHKDSPTQKWLLTDAGDGYVRLTSNGKALDIKDQSTTDNAPLITTPSADRDSQKWRIHYTAEGFYTLTNKHSGKNLSVSAGSKDDAAPIQQSPPADTPAQKWRMDAVDTQDAWSTWKWVPNIH